MAVEKFRVESSHIMMFARSIGDPNPVFDCTVTDPSGMVAICFRAGEGCAYRAALARRTTMTTRRILCMTLIRDRYRPFFFWAATSSSTNRLT